MKLHRFCSQREFAAYERGELLKSHTDHSHGGAGGSISRGFCFFKGNVNEWARRLNGIVDFYVLLTVDVDPKHVHLSMGVYADWSKDDGQSMPPKALFTEYCACAYDKKNFRLISADSSYRNNPRFVSRSEILAMYPKWAEKRAFSFLSNLQQHK